MKKVLFPALCILLIIMLAIFAAPQAEAPFAYWTEDAAAIAERSLLVNVTLHFKMCGLFSNIF